MHKTIIFLHIAPPPPPTPVRETLCRITPMCSPHPYEYILQSETRIENDAQRQQHRLDGQKPIGALVRRRAGTVCALLIERREKGVLVGRGVRDKQAGGRGKLKARRPLKTIAH